MLARREVVTMNTMFRGFSWAIAAGCGLGVATQAQAQSTTLQPGILSVICEWVKPGMGPAHDKHEEAWARASEGVKGFASSFAIQTMTGPAETCWLTKVSNFEALGKNFDAYTANPNYAAMLPSLLGEDAKYVSDTRSYIAVLRTDLSQGDMPTLQDRRYTEWGEWRIRPGSGPAFATALKGYVAAAKRAGVPLAFRVFQVMHGAPGETYWMFTTQATMAGFDAVMASDPKTVGAFTSDDNKLFDEFFAKAVVSTNSNIWAYSPAQSALTSEQRGSDPFWKLKPKPAPTKKP